jgi:hypothetical protein
MSKLRQREMPIDKCPVGITSETVGTSCMKSDPCTDCPYFGMWPDAIAWKK